MTLLEAVQHFAAALKRLTSQLGIPGKYHETITWFFMFLIEERRKEFIRLATGIHSGANNDDLFARGEDGILNRYYKRANAGQRPRTPVVLAARPASEPGFLE